jgi:uncharacterized protein (DUF2236 family)
VLLIDPLVDPVKARIGASLRERITGTREARAFGTSEDLGWFGPGSVCWLVHADLGSMMIGGFSSLFLQTLHPGAMAGVDQHSNWREDPMGRLQRTAGFIGTTTYGSVAEAEKAVRLVRRVHTRVVGVREDGLPYAASDPDLLRWVHVAESWQFLRAYQRYHRTRLSAAEKDQYLDEVALVAEKLGATDVPRSVAEVTRYLRAVRGELAVTEAARATVRDLLRSAGDPVERAGREVILRASIALLPGWARDMLDLNRRFPGDDQLSYAAGAALSTSLRWVFGPLQLPTEAAAATA